MIVVDASAATAFITSRSPFAQGVRALVASAEELNAPHLIDTEVTSAMIGLGRGTRGEAPKISKADLDRYLKEFADLPITRHAVLHLTPRVRVLAANLSVYDATYVALAEALGVPLVTTDARIRRGAGTMARCEIIDFAHTGL
ncbi:type II toxin-antitoxin system VapC family toxin [Streptomyces sp. CC77]|uniref:type II toxin-antitoxin system VapC family toxin n=1 Tax=Streptomyces sp. CC77 TaxID=1906739 RepID=UPI0008DE1DC5|nr:type II toxin-antitoxin system VapC family toxin [Streptomyces sp. CC77]OII70437.1 hypothetical protein BJP39_02760 [Streptomyces sp. CC77]